MIPEILSGNIWWWPSGQMATDEAPDLVSVRRAALLPLGQSGLTYLRCVTGEVLFTIFILNIMEDEETKKYLLSRCPGRYCRKSSSNNCINSLVHMHYYMSKKSWPISYIGWLKKTRDYRHFGRFWNFFPLVTANSIIENVTIFGYLSFVGVLITPCFDRGWVEYDPPPKYFICESNRNFRIE